MTNSPVLQLAEILSSEFDDAVTDLAWSPNGDLDAISADGRLFVSEGSSSFSSPDVRGCISQAWDPSGQRLAVSDHSGGIGVWSRTGWNALESPSGWGTRLSWSSTGVLAASAGGSILLYDLGHRRATSGPRVIADLPGTVMDLAWRADDYLCAATLEGTWVIDHHADERVLVSERGISSLALAVANNGTLAVALATGQILVRWTGSSVAHLLEGNGEPLWNVAWNEHASTCVAATEGLVVAWRALDDGAVADTPTVVRTRGSDVVGMAVSPASPLVASADLAGMVLVWDCRPGAELMCRWQSRTPIHCCAWSAEGRRIAVGTDTGISLLECSPLDV